MSSNALSTRVPPSSMCIGLLAVAITGCGTSTSEDPGLGTIDPATGCLTFGSTFDAIQTLVFDRQGCSADACHGTGMSDGLDLRVGHSYDSLVEAATRCCGGCEERV